ncbi:MAG: acetylxylan esterase [Tannerella sp.]|jgi:dienelactone hydrolase|nr:acetylxylan esterase [Tannerella sp.]
MNDLRCFYLILFFGIYLNSNAQEDLSVMDYWQFNGNTANVLYDNICSHAFTQISERQAYVNGLKSARDWTDRQVTLRKIMEEMVGGFPPKTPLNAKITGTIKRDGFTVEKLYFESRPGFYVTAALFLPASKNGKLPAIVYCCGHSVNGLRQAGYQRSIMNLVKKGFIVLALDPVGQGERIQYFDADGKSIFSPTHEHSYPGSQSFMAGLSPANYFIWDGIRAVDYLLSRKEVDPARIGITGRSGGGTQSALIAAMDDRILAAAHECYITTFDKLLRSIGPQDAEQIFMYSLNKSFDISDLIEIRAPKPLLMVTTTHDIFSIQGARDVYGEARNAYIALGQPDNLLMVEDDAGHANTLKNREALHAFFQKFLNNPGDPKDEEVELFDDKDLWATQTGQVMTSLKDAETLFSLNEKYAASVVARRQAEKLNNPDYLSDIAKKAELLTGYCKPDLPKESIFSGRLWRDGSSIEKYLVKGAGNYYIPVLRLSSGNPSGKVVLLLDEKGKASAAANGGIAEKLLSKGYQVVIPDLSGFGELTGTYKGGDAIIQGVPINIWYAGILTQKSPLGIRVEEIKIIVDFIKESGAYGTLTGVACGTLTSDLLHAAVINRDFHRLALINPLLSYESVVQEKNYLPKYLMSAPAGVIGQYDLPDLITALTPLNICLLNPVNALDQPADSDLIETILKDAGKEYGNWSNLLIATNEEDVYAKLYQWLE